jgi:hypothetical protein
LNNYSVSHWRTRSWPETTKRVVNSLLLEGPLLLSSPKQELCQGLFPLQVDLSICCADRECSKLSALGRPPIAVRGSFPYAVQHGGRASTTHSRGNRIRRAQRAPTYPVSVLPNWEMIPASLSPGSRTSNGTIHCTLDASFQGSGGACGRMPVVAQCAAGPACAVSRTILCERRFRHKESVSAIWLMQVPGRSINKLWVAVLKRDHTSST